MIEYIIGVIHAIDILCNLGLLLTLYAWNEVSKAKWTLNKTFYIVLIVCLLGIIFIPSKETLEILLLNK